MRSSRGPSVLATSRAAELQSSARGANQPGVDRETFACGYLVHSGFQVFGETEIDAGGSTLVSLGREDPGQRVLRLFSRRLGLGEVDYELGRAAPQPQLDRPGCQLAGDLLGRSGEGVLQS